MIRLKRSPLLTSSDRSPGFRLKATLPALALAIALAAPSVSQAAVWEVGCQSAYFKVTGHPSKPANTHALFTIGRNGNVTKVGRNFAHSAIMFIKLSNGRPLIFNSRLKRVDWVKFSGRVAQGNRRVRARFRGKAYSFRGFDVIYQGTDLLGLNWQHVVFGVFSYNMGNGKYESVPQGSSDCASTVGNVLTRFTQYQKKRS